MGLLAFTQKEMTLRKWRQECRHCMQECVRHKEEVWGRQRGNDV